MFEQVELWGFLAGLGLFLLGMHFLEAGLRGLGTRSMKKFLREQTSSPIRGVFTGTVVTAFLQSSSMVGLIVLAFVGAGIFELRNALGIIIGSNLGTTFTGWIVTLIGFKLDLGNYAQPMLALGAMGTVFLRQGGKPFYYSNLLLGLGLLLLGLDQMTGAFYSLAENMDISFLQGRNLFYYFFAGMLLTAIIQSSSVSMMILLSAMHTGIITLGEAAPFAIGADLGTTSTVLLGALKGSDEKRRVAFSHFFFNVVTDLLALLLLPLLLYFITSVVHISDPLFSLVAFHSLFNVIGILVFLPLVDRFIRFLHWLVPDTEVEICSHIDRVPVKVADAAIEAIQKDLAVMFAWAIKLNLHCFKINPESISKEELYTRSSNAPYEDNYAMLKRSGGELLGYTYSVQGQTQDEEDIRQLTQLNHAIRNVNYAAKFIKDNRHNLVDFRHSTTSEVEKNYTEFNNLIKYLYRKLVELAENKNPELSEEKYQELKKEIRSTYERLHHGIYLASGENSLDDEETSNLLNVNRAIYVSNTALLEAVHVLLLPMEDNSTIPPPEIVQPV